MKILDDDDNYDEMRVHNQPCPYQHGVGLPQVAMDEMVTRYGI